MNKTQIEWVKNPDGSQGYTSNPVRGECPVNCVYCYVKPLRVRYGWHKDIRYYPLELEAIYKRKKPSGIFVGSTIELLHEKTIQYMPDIMDCIKACPQHRFYILTKCPRNLPQFSPFPDNCWVGVTVTNRQQLKALKQYFDNPIVSNKSIRANIKFISIEPLLEPIICNHEWETHSGKPYTSTARVMPRVTCSKCGDNRNWLDNTGLIGSGGKPIAQWLIIGAQTNPYKPPKREWVKDIIKAADKCGGVSVFLKNNIIPMFPEYIDREWAPPPFFTADWDLRQEMPRL